MLSLIEQIKSGALWDFPGGVHPPENKQQSLSQPIERASIADEIVLPIKQHIGKPGDLIVAVGEKVLKGQPLTKYDTSFMLPVHAPTSGTISAIEQRTTAHPSGLSELCVVIRPDMQDTWCELKPSPDFTQESPEELIEHIRQAGISGMGGAGFPTAKKIQSGLARTEILIINAAECEPYITADDTLMRHYAEEIIKGIEIVEHILKPKLTIIGIEDNKPEAVEALTQAAHDSQIVVRVIPTKYPSGGEKQLIKILTNKEVPNGGIPADIGILVQNVGSLYATKRAVCDGEPLIERIVTLTGSTFKQPRNVWAPIGTPVQSLLAEFNHKAEKKNQRLILGGPMMGFTLPHSNVPITKTTNCILAPTRKEIAPDRFEMACIRCSQCAEVCPASLLPQQLQWHAKAQELDKCEELNLKDCIECGACAYVCPSEIPLVQYYRQAKAEIRTRKLEAESAERAKQRFEEKNARMERDKAERENRFKKAAENRRKDMKQPSGDDAIAAAIARVKAQKEQTQAEEKPTLKPAVAAAIAKAKAKQAAAMETGKTELDNSEMAKLREERKQQARARKAEKAQESDSAPDTSESGDSKKDAVAAAIARAKARKAQAAEPESTEVKTEESEDPKKAAVAAAIARAKARKAQAAEPESTEVQTDESEDPKKAAVAAAITRAKARKAQATEPDSTEVKTEESEDPKKAAVAAAIARAKARKAQAAEPESTEEQTEESEDPKKAAVAAAIARAKARKAQAAEADATEVQAEESEDPKKAAVAAAIARAKARKAQAAEAEATDVQAEESEDPKKAAVAAAIARAKARKAQAAEADATDVQAEESEDPKKAAVAAAIARAKARKAEKEQLEKQEQSFEEKE
ncbi:electron transport complex subunit RsxC [Vibrio paucivorans]